MNAKLEQRLGTISDQFVADLIGLLREVVVDVVGSPGKTATKAASSAKVTGSSRAPQKGRRRRRSLAEALQLADKIAKLLQSESQGLGAEQLSAKLGISSYELMLPIKKALKSKTIKKSGQKRATKYFVVKR